MQENYKGVFKRYEKKYLLSGNQYTELMKALEKHTVPDPLYPTGSIMNIYYDTPDFRLIRCSLDKPEYKEKLRLRSYSVPDADTTVFCELKKKYSGVVYKRRQGMKYRYASGFLNQGVIPANSSQIEKEIKYVLDFYGQLVPAMYISYERDSYSGNIFEPELRITFDRDIKWRSDDLELSSGSYGSPLLNANERLMEIKLSSSMPLWLAKELSGLNIFPATFSKYGEAYKTLLKQNNNVFIGGIYCA